MMLCCPKQDPANFVAARLMQTPMVHGSALAIVSAQNLEIAQLKTPAVANLKVQ